MWKGGSCPGKQFPGRAVVRGADVRDSYVGRLYDHAIVSSVSVELSLMLSRKQLTMIIIYSMSVLSCESVMKVQTCCHCQ